MTTRLSDDERAQIKKALSETPDVIVRHPLWHFSPAMRPFIMHERRRRFGVDEDIGDSEYS